ncbi:hypothetical protein AABB87_16650, partial [Roseateles sp. PN1]
AERAAAERAAAERAAAERAAAERAAALKAEAEAKAAEEAMARQAQVKALAEQRAADQAAELALAEARATAAAQLAEAQETEAQEVARREQARLAREAQAERERAELAAFLHIDLNVGLANAKSAAFDPTQIQIRELAPQQDASTAQALELDLASIQLPPATPAPALDLGALGDLSQMLAKVAQTSRQAAPAPEALDLHRVAQAAQLRR